MGSPEQQGIELAKEAVKQLFAPVQDLLQRLLGPAAAEVGLSSPIRHVSGGSSGPSVYLKKSRRWQQPRKLK